MRIGLWEGTVAKTEPTAPMPLPPPPWAQARGPRTWPFPSPLPAAGRGTGALPGQKPSLCHIDRQTTRIKGRNCHLLVPLRAQSGLNPGLLSVLPGRASPPVTGSRNAKDFHPFIESEVFKVGKEGFPGGPVIKNPPANAGDTGLIPDLGRSHLSQSN